MVIFNLRITVIPNKKTETMNILNSLLGPTEVQPGCRCCRLYDNTEMDNEIFLLQEWESQQRLEHYIRSVEFRKILAAMDLAREPPALAFHTISGTAGFELVEKLCK